MRSTCQVLGLGCYLLLVLLVLLSGALFESAALAARCQTPLTVSCDAGALLGFGTCLVASRRLPPAERSFGKIVAIQAILACGLCASVMVRSGMLFEAFPFDTVIGDVLFGGFLAIAACQWWLALMQDPTDRALLRLAQALGGASVALVLLSLAPQGLILLFAGLLAPFATSACLAILLGQAAEGAPAGYDSNGQPAPLPSEAEAAVAVPRNVRRDNPACSGRDKPTILPRVLPATVILSVVVADLLMNLFPVSLYNEPSPLFAPLTGSRDALALSNLTEPAFIAACLLAAFSCIFGLMASRSAVKLPVLCSIGFFAVAVGFVTFPYHMAGGAPIGIAEAGRVIIVVFAYSALRRYLDGRAGKDQTEPVLRLAIASLAGMIAADVLVIALYQYPPFDYIDFKVRTIFGGAGLLALVALLLGPMPHVYTAVRKEEKSDDAAALSDQSAQQERHAELRLDALAEKYRLSPREKEIVELISQGRDVPYIEQELVLSKSTVKTHIRHVYEKCGVSSRQDLLDLLLACG